jgi:hypothetical protein
MAVLHLPTLPIHNLSCQSKAVEEINTSIELIHPVLIPTDLPQF